MFTKKRARDETGKSGYGQKKAKPSSGGQQQAGRREVSTFPAETKYFDVAFGGTVSGAADWTGTEVPCTSYIQADGTTVGAYTASALIPSAVGPGYGEVTGSKYYLKKIRVRGEIAGQAAPDLADVPGMRTVRVVLVHDTQPNGTQAQGEEVFTDLGGATACNYSFLAMGAGAGGRFRILADEIVKLQPASSATDGTNTSSTGYTGELFSFAYKPNKPIQVMLKANASTPAVAALSNCNIFCLIHASSTVPSITYAGAARTYYCD